MSDLSPPRRRPLWQTGALAYLGAVFIALGGWAACAPTSFGLSIADFGEPNIHLIRDYAAASLAIGIALVVAAHQISWRAPVLWVAAWWNGLHTVSHVIDLHDAGSRAVGIAEIGLLAAVTIALALFAREVSR